MIKGITFDLWDTLFIDDTDEPKRKAAGRAPKPVERRQFVFQFLQRHGKTSRTAVDIAYNAADASFRKVWHDLHVTWTVRERLDIVLKALGRDLPEEEMAELVRLHEEMELEFRPDSVPGVHDAIRQLHKKYKLAVVSDAIFSPGRCLRTLLKDEGLLDCFDLFVFSDEVGHSKPEPKVFQAAWEGLGLKPEQVVHIGDREHNDILGPLKVGMNCILCTAAIDRGSNNSAARFKFDNYEQLPTVIEALSRAVK